MTPSTNVIVRCYIQLAGSQQVLYSTESYGELSARINAARETAKDNPLAPPLINTRMIASLGTEDGSPIVVDAQFNPLSVLMIWRAHPEV